MKKNLMFFVLGVSTTLLLGAGVSYWNEIQQANKYGVLVDRLSAPFENVPNNNKYGVLVDRLSAPFENVPNENKYGVLVDRLSAPFENVPNENKYGVLVDRLSAPFENVPNENKYALVLDGEIGNDAKRAMVVGFVHGMAVGRRKAREE